MNMVHNHGQPMSFHSPFMHHSTNLLGLLYIHNCDSFATSTDGLHIRTTITQLQCNINLWQGGLAVTGGFLSPVKSSWCIMAMRPQGKWWTFHTIKSLLANLPVQNTNWQPQPIRQIHPNEDCSGGSYSISPRQPAFQAKANSWEMALCNGYLPCSLEWVAVHRVL